MMNTKPSFNRSNLAKALFPLTLLISSSAFANTNFSDYCTVNTTADCSSQFQTALLDAVANGDSLIMEAGVYNIESFDPNANGITYSAVDLVGQGSGLNGTIINTRYMRFVDSSIVRISNIRFNGSVGNKSATAKSALTLQDEMRPQQTSC